jgi:hypothetical protein
MSALRFFALGFIPRIRIDQRSDFRFDQAM